MNNIQQGYIKQFVGFFQSVAELSRVSADVPTYRLLQLPNEKDPNVHFHIVNKRMTLKMLPEEIMKDSMLLQFSKADIALITHSGTKNELKASLSIHNNKAVKILKQFFQKGKTFFVIEKEEGVVEEYAANEIYSDINITEKLSGTDGIKVGYSVAEEHYTAISKLKKAE
jgi:hypothetical protein